MVRFINPSEGTHDRSCRIFGFSSEQKEGASQKVFDCIQTKGEDETKSHIMDQVIQTFENVNNINKLHYFMAKNGIILRFC